MIGEQYLDARSRNHAGLSALEAEKRHKELGPNELPHRDERSTLRTVGEYPSRHARLRPSIGQSVLVSYSFLRHYDEAKTLLKSQPQIWAIGADGEQFISSILNGRKARRHMARII